MGILEGKSLLLTGVLTDQSIAFHVARLAQEEGANVVLSSFGRALSLTTRIAGRLPQPVPVVELDVRPLSAATSSTPSGRTSRPPCTSRRTR